MAKRSRRRPRRCSAPNLVYLFPFYLRGDGTSEQRKMVEAHLESCAECRKEMAFIADLQRVGKKLYGKVE